MIDPPSNPAWYDGALFDIAPVPMSVLDCSGLKIRFAQLRAQGIADLGSWLSDDQTRIKDCLGTLRIVKSNQRDMAWRNKNNETVAIRQPVTYRDELLTSYAYFLEQLWNGRTDFSTKLDPLTRGGGRCDLKITTAMVPDCEPSWSCMIMVIEDVSAEEEARRQLALSEAYARTLFEQSPVSLWVEDFSLIKIIMQELRAGGVTDLRAYIDNEPDFVRSCLRKVRYLDVNQQTIVTYQAPDKETFFSRLTEILRDETLHHFKEELVDFWQGKLRQRHETTNYLLDGEQRSLVLQLSVMPGYEHDWSLVLVALTDITAQKKAEAALEYLGQHDVLTGLRNRSFYHEELRRLERHGPFPVTVIIADLNGLKPVNDRDGHHAGDALLRRLGEVLTAVIAKPAQAARIGGDEFVILLPATGEAGGAEAMQRIQAMIAHDNCNHPAHPLSVSMGMATARVNRLEATVQQADLQMYEAKRAYYALTPEQDRREHGLIEGR